MPQVRVVRRLPSGAGGAEKDRGDPGAHDAQGPGAAAGGAGVKGVPVYMDNHATTRVDPRVVEAMLPYFDTKYGNPHSVHAAGHEARDAVDTARQSIATAIGADATEIVFTSGATESNNLAIRGVAERERRRGNHLVSVATEHKAVLDPLA